MPIFARFAFVWISLFFVFIAPAKSQQGQASISKEKCDAIIKAHGFLSRAQFQCGYQRYSDEMILSARECSAGKTQEQINSLLRNGMETFDRNERESSHDAICQDILNKFEGTVGRSKFYELEKLESEVRDLLGKGQLREAKAAATRLRERAEQLVGKNHDAYANSLQAIGVIQLSLGESTEAFESFRDALPLAESLWGPDSPVVGELLNNLGESLRRRAQNDAAAQMFRRALEVHKKNEGVESERYAETEVNLAMSLPRGKSPEAERMLQHAYKVFKTANGESDPRLGVVLINIAVLQRHQGKLAECEGTLTAALNKIPAVAGSNGHARTHAINELADVLFAQKKFQEAKVYYEQVVDLFRNMFGDRHYKLAMAYSRLANIAFASILENPERVIELSKTGLAFRRKAYESTRGYEHVVPKGSIADVGIEGGEGARAVQLAYLFALDTAKKLGIESEGDLDRESFMIGQVLMESSVGDVFKLMAGRLAAGSSEQALDLRKLQDAILKRREIELSSIQQLKEGNLTSLVNVKIQLGALDQEIRSSSASIDGKFPQYSSLINSKPLTVEEVQSQLADDEALVSILAENGHLNVWVVTKKELRWVPSIEKTNIEKANGIPEELGTTADIDRLRRDAAMLRCGLEFEAWTRGGSECGKLLEITYSGADYAAGRPLPFRIQAAYDLYQLLFKEVADLLVGKRLLIVPSDVLSGIPFQVLISVPPIDADFRSMRWLARDHAITVLPAVSSLKALRATGHPSAAAKPLIGFGNPLLDGPDSRYAENAKLSREKQSCPKTTWQRMAALLGLRESVAPIETRGGLADVSLIRRQAPLPETADELCAVARDIGADMGEIRLGAHATEGEVKAMNKDGKLAQYRIVHFATHGATAGELKGSIEPGLILTPPAVPDTDDDGFLTASEIASLRLDADWVILSACNTAAAQQDNAAALSGLARAFFYAGARSVLVTHWSINSDAAVKLITTLIKELSIHGVIGRDEALRRAMLALIENGGYSSHPSFWGPFSLVGESIVRH